MLILVILATLTGCASMPQEQGETPSSILLAPAPVYADISLIGALSQNPSGSLPYEEARIDYLFERLEQTHYNFVRNNTVYSRPRALVHLKWKYLKVRKDIHTAEDFVELVASGSKLSGRPYLLQGEDKQHYLLSMVLFNELRELEKALSEMALHELDDETGIESGTEVKKDGPQAETPTQHV